MSDPNVVIRFDGNGRTYHAGEVLAGSYGISGVWAGDVKAVEVSVLWHTEGKGDEDLAVHHFQRETTEEASGGRPPTTGEFQTTLPNSPLSYQGAIVKLGWCVRVRVFLYGGKEFVREAPFRLEAPQR